MKLVNEGGMRITGTKWNPNYDQEIIEKFHLGIRMSKFQFIKTCYWIPPEQECVMFCCDGSSFGKPGSAGFGVVVRDSNCQVLGVLTGDIDSKDVLAEFSQGRVPWFLKGRWSIATRKLSSIRYEHCYMEVNFSADNMAKKGASFAAGVRQIPLGRPQCLPRVEMPNVEYYRFG
ncbi:uncharacterized protein LOC113331842 [Papaver somniferum]|uniref:uncharacterized protein LOC113331842 n=1 Tax=Papaver somniferum TaxID=3469 RepID=UPI000E700336|nr:uncharacterized protein LOC113331842 [Papaver somniferum]